MPPEGEGGAVDGEVLPPSPKNAVNPPAPLGAGNPHAVVRVPALDNLRNIRREMEAIYKLARKGRILVEEATRLIYVLDQIGKAVKIEKEVEELQAAYSAAFQGMVVKLADPKDIERARKDME